MANWTTVGTWTAKYSTIPVTNYKALVTTTTTGAIVNGWVCNNFRAYQKVNGAVYVYVERMAFGMYRTQLYMRGTASVCTLEARTTSNTADPTIIFNLAENWLIQYGDGDMKKITSDFYYIDNPDGAWGTNSHLKLYYIN